MDNVMDDSRDDNVIYMYGKEVHDQLEMDYEMNDEDAVTISFEEYEDLIADSAFLFFLEETVGPSVWSSACEAFEKWNEEKVEDSEE